MFTVISAIASLVYIEHWTVIHQATPWTSCIFNILFLSWILCKFIESKVKKKNM